MNQKGISLVQVVIAGGIAAGIGLYIAKMSQTASKSAETFRQKIAMTFIKAEMRDVLRVSDNCVKTLTNSDLNPLAGAGDQVDAVVSRTPSNTWHTLYERHALNEITYDGVAIQNMMLTDQIPAAGGVMSAQVDGRYWLQVTYDKSIIGGGRRTFGAQQMVDYIPLVVSRDDNDNITSCGTDTAQQLVNQMCTGLGATYDENSGDCVIVGMENYFIGCDAYRAFRGIKIVSKQLCLSVVNGTDCRIYPVYEAICGDEVTENPPASLSEPASQLATE